MSRSSSCADGWDTFAGFASRSSSAADGWDTFAGFASRLSSRADAWDTESERDVFAPATPAMDKPLLYLFVASPSSIG